MIPDFERGPLVQPSFASRIRSRKMRCGLGRILIRVTDSDGNRSTMAYDRWGNQVMAKDGEGRRTVRQFDERGRLVVELAPSGAMTHLVYDEHDRLTDMISLEDGSEVARKPSPTPRPRNSPTWP